MGQTRLTAGINSQRFAWTLEAGAEFWTPEAVDAADGFMKEIIQRHKNQKSL